VVAILGEPASPDELELAREEVLAIATQDPDASDDQTQPGLLVMMVGVVGHSREDPRLRLGQRDLFSAHLGRTFKMSAEQRKARSRRAASPPRAP
jgi:hypothetical protein